MTCRPATLTRTQRAGFSLFAHSGEGGLITKPLKWRHWRKDAPRFRRIVAFLPENQGKWHGIGIARDITDASGPGKAHYRPRTVLSPHRHRGCLTPSLKQNAQAARHHLPCRHARGTSTIQADHDAYAHQVAMDVLVERPGWFPENPGTRSFARWGGEEWSFFTNSNAGTCGFWRKSVRPLWKCMNFSISVA